MTRKRPPTDSPDDAERKERVIHTRVPESLETELRERAQDLGISVSNLVRNVLGHAFGLVGDVAADAHAIARAARGERIAAQSATPVASPAPTSVAPVGDAPLALAEVIAWQPIVLAKNALCARCNDILPRGSDAAIAIADRGAKPIDPTAPPFGGATRPAQVGPIVCMRCLEELRR